MACEGNQLEASAVVQHSEREGEICCVSEPDWCPAPAPGAEIVQHFMESVKLPHCQRGLNQRLPPLRKPLGSSRLRVLVCRGLSS